MTDVTDDDREVFSDGKRKFVRPLREIFPATTEGCDGYFGPNSTAYAVRMNTRLAMDLRRTIQMFCYGYMPDCDGNSLHMNPLSLALIELGKFDQENCRMANWDHCPEIFDPSTI